MLETSLASGKLSAMTSLVTKLALNWALRGGADEQEAAIHRVHGEPMQSRPPTHFVTDNREEGPCTLWGSRRQSAEVEP